jgi:hypothetical protein
MRLFLENDTVFEEEAVGNNLISKSIGHIRKVGVQPFSVRVGEEVVVPLSWLIFDPAKQEYVLDTNNTTLFNITVGEQTGEIVPSDGVGEFTFSSVEVGTYKIVVNSEEIEVIVSA